MQEWHDVIRLTGSAAIAVERVRILDRNVAVEGEFELPPLSRLSVDDQMFVIAFIRSHGSIKEMEELFGISYPTVKNRLKRIAGRLEFVEVDPPASRSDILDQLDKGTITVDEAEKKLRGEA